MQPTIVSNVKNWRPHEDGSVFSFIKTFANTFKFITRNEVNLQQNHQDVRVRKNAIILSSKGFNFKTKAHLSQFTIFIMRMMCQHQIRGWLMRWFFIHLCDLKLIRHGHTQCHEFKEMKKSFNQNQLDNECVEDLHGCNL